MVDLILIPYHELWQKIGNIYFSIIMINDIDYVLKFTEWSIKLMLYASKSSLSSLHSLW